MLTPPTARPAFVLLVLLALLSPAAHAGTIRADLTDLADVLGPGGDYWQVAYSLEDFDFDADQSIRIRFDHARYASLLYTGLPAQPDWDVFVAQPLPGFLADGVFDALAETDDPATGEPFVLRFVWLGGGTPGSQPYTVDQFDAQGAYVSTLEAGETLAVPEPGLLALLALAGLGLRARRRARAALLAGTFGLATWLPAPASAIGLDDGPVQIVDLVLEGVQPVTRRITQYTYRPTVKNVSEKAFEEVSARLVLDGEPGAAVIDGERVKFGRVEAGATAQSIETVTVEIDAALFRPETEFRWLVSGLGQVKLAAGTVALDTETCEKVTGLSPDRSRLFLSEITPLVAGLQVGEVITAPAMGDEGDPLFRGFIGRVVSITVDDEGAVEIETSEADVTDAIDEVEFGLVLEGKTPAEIGGDVNLGTPHEEDPLTRLEGNCLIDENGERPPGPMPAPPVPDGSGGIARCDFGEEGHGGYAEPIGPIVLTEGVELTGSLRMQGPTVAMSVKMQGSTVERFRFSMTAQQALTLVLLADVEEEFEETNPFLNIVLAQFTLNVGPVPVTFTLRLLAETETSGFFNGKGKISFVEQAEFAAGFELEEGEWTSSLITNVDARVSDPELRELNASVEASIKPRIEFTMDLVGGPYVEAVGFIRLDADALADPLWQVTAGTEIFAGVDVNPLGIEVVQERTLLFQDEKVIAGDNPFVGGGAGGGTLPGAAAAAGGTAGQGVEDLEAGDELRWSKVYPLAGNDTALDLSPAEDGEFVISGAGPPNRSGIVLKVDRFGDIVWQRQLPILQTLRASEALAGGDVAIAGQRGNNVWAAQLDESGDLVWYTQIDPEGSAFQGDIYVAEVAGNNGPEIVVVGTRLAPDLSERDLFAVRFDDDGDVVWAKTFGAAGTLEEAFFATELASGTLAMGGWTSDPIPLQGACADFTPANLSGFGLLVTPEGDLIEGLTIGTGLLTGVLRAAADDLGDGSVQWAGETGFTPLDNSPAMYLPPYHVGPVGATLLSELRGIDSVVGGFVGVGKYGILGDQTAAMFRMATHRRSETDEPIVGFGTGGLWWMEYGGPGVDLFEDVAAAGDGFLASGHSTSFSADQDLWLVRTGEDGFVRFREETGGTSGFGQLFEQRSNSRALGNDCVDNTNQTKLHPTVELDLPYELVAVADPVLTDPGIVPVELVRDPAPAPPSACGLGVELGVVLPLLAALARRRRRA